MKRYKLTITDDDNQQHQIEGDSFISFMFDVEGLLKHINELQFGDSLEILSSGQSKILDWAGE